MTMRTKSLGALAAGLLGCASPVQADDWTSGYIGIGGGMGAANHDLSFENGPGLGLPFNAELSGLGGDGGFFSLGVGLDYQVNSRFVVGGFFDYDWTNFDTALDASVSFGGPTFGAGADIEVEDMWSIGGRLGYLVSPSTMLFVTAGYTKADVSDLTANVSNFGSVTLASVGDFDGYFIGGGAEMKITKAISIKGEYRYTDLDSEVITLLPGTGAGAFINEFVTTKLDPDIQTARVSLNYRFGLGGDTGVEPEEPSAPMGSWTQFYLGIGGGYAFTNEELTLSNGPAVVPPPSFNVGFDGFGGEGGALTIGGGYDYQFAPKFVAGLLIDYTMHGADTDLDLNIGTIVAANVGFGLDNELSIGGRLGYLVTPATLIYGSIGYSRIELDDARLSATVGLGSFGTRLASSGAIDGFFLGGGIETKITDNISLKLDYRYTNGDSEQITLLPDVLPQANDFVRAEIDPDIQTIRMSLDYRFNFGNADPAPLK
jgi:outer membrane immunogenic protein